MRKRFKAKKRKNKLIIVLLIIVIFILYKLMSNLVNISFFNSNEELIKILLNDSNHHMLNSSDNLVKKMGSTLLNSEVIRPINILEKTYHLPVNASDLTFTYDNTEYISDPVVKKITNPLVYIYNTHQLEGYEKDKMEDYNIKPNVMMASYILREKLNKKNINTLVETGDITTLLNSNGWDYSNSYKASRYFIQDVISKNKDLKLIIDIHRDAISKKSSTVTIDNKNYAKLLFVVGLEHKNYEKNLALANKLNDLIKAKYPSLTRGILKKSGKNVNGIYNQDLSENIILIECGGYKNTIDEVNNTMELFSEIVADYLEET